MRKKLLPTWSLYSGRGRYLISKLTSKLHKHQKISAVKKEVGREGRVCVWGGVQGRLWMGVQL